MLDLYTPGEGVVYTRTGGLDFGREDCQALHEVVTSCKEFGVPCENLSPSDTTKRFPGTLNMLSNVTVDSSEQDTVARSLVFMTKYACFTS